MLRRLALYSDIHANLPALDAVLADIAASKIADRYCLGDLVGYGPAPSEVIERIRSTGDPVIQGNYDRGVGGRLGDCGCYYATDQARADGAASYDFTVAATSLEEAAYLSGLMPSLRLEVDGAQILLCHGSPRKVNEYLMPDRPAEQLVRLAREADADLVCCGHVHIPYHRRLEGPDGHVHYVSTGSVGKPKDGDPRACWVELILGDESEVCAACTDPAQGAIGRSDVHAGIVVHRVEYDVTAVAQAVIAVGLPSTLAEALFSV